MKMTKNVRIENADNATYKVVVEVWEMHPDGDVMTETIPLNSPTDMCNKYLTSTRYLKVKEA